MAKTNSNNIGDPSQEGGDVNDQLADTAATQTDGIPVTDAPSETSETVTTEEIPQSPTADAVTETAETPIENTPTLADAIPDKSSQIDDSFSTPPVADQVSETPPVSETPQIQTEQILPPVAETPSAQENLPQTTDEPIETPTPSENASPVYEAPPEETDSVPHADNPGDDDPNKLNLGGSFNTDTAITATTIPTVTPPTVGRIVHFYPQENDELARSQHAEFIPALVLQNWGDDECHLKIFPVSDEPGITIHYGVHHQTKTVGVGQCYWIWPPRV